MSIKGNKCIHMSPRAINQKRNLHALQTVMHFEQMHEKLQVNDHLLTH